MKRHTLVLTLIASTSLALTAAEDPNPTSSVNPSPSATPDGGGPRCTLNSASVEVHTYYGTRKTLTEKVSQMPFDLSERRVFLQATQRGKTDSALTDVKLFERQKDGSLAITEWSKAKAPSLLEDLDHSIIKNKGEKCVGEAMKDVLVRKLGEGKPLAPLPASASLSEAFGPSVKDDSSEDFLKTIIIFGC